VLERQMNHPKPYYLRAFAGYLVLTLLMLAPVMLQLGGAIPGGRVAQRDAWQNVWNLWWVRHALAHGQDMFISDLLYYPIGVNLHLQTLNASNGVLFAPITALFGPIAAYNIATILAFALAGLGAYALALRVSGHVAGSFLGGLIFTFSPFHLTKLWDGQLEMIALQWIPLYALFLLRAVEDRRIRDTLLAGVFLALIGYTSWYYFLFLAVYSALFAVLWLGFPPHKAPRGPVLFHLILVGIIGAVLLLPILLPALRSVGGAEAASVFDPSDALDLRTLHSADLIDFWLPSELHPLWGPTVTQLTTSIHPYIGARNVALGYVALALALIAAFRATRLAWRWCVLAGGALVLALGPVLQVGGQLTGILLPYVLLLNIPGAEIANRPSHFVVITTLMLAPLAALGVATLTTGGARGSRAPGSQAPGSRTSVRMWERYRPHLLFCVLFFELITPPIPLIYPNAHPHYRALAQEPGPILIVPAQLESSDPLQAQMVHGRPMVGGFVSRMPAYPFVAEVAGVRELWAARGLRPAFGEQAKQELVALNSYGIRRLVVEWQHLKPAEQQRMQELLARMLPGVAPEYQDAQLSSYRIPEAAVTTLAYLGEGWHSEEREGERRWRWMMATGEVLVFNPFAQPRSVVLTLDAQSHTGERTVQLLFDGRNAGNWQVRPATTTITLRLLVPPGQSRLQLVTTADQEQVAPMRSISIALLDLQVR
jgi:hypothetical protein